MTKQQWDLLLKVINGDPIDPQIGFIIDSPWLPGWAKCSTLDYYTSDEKWFQANMQAIQTFPETLFLPGFWSEYGMCTEPSAFGSKLVWAADNLPHADKVILDSTSISKLAQPNVETDGLLPFVVNRLINTQNKIQDAGHEIKFAIARGPLNIASFLMGSTEFLMLLAMQPDAAHELLEKITVFTQNWLLLQKEKFPSIDGILLLDDIVGFIGEDDCRNFVVPYLTRLFSSFPASVRLFHNDAHGLVCAPFLQEIGVNMFNFSFEHTINEMRDALGPQVAMLGNLPPRDVLAAATPEKVAKETQKMFDDVEDKSRVLWSCGGGMPQDVSTENINAFIQIIKTEL